MLAAAGRNLCHARVGVLQMSNPADQPSSDIGRASTVASLVEQLYNNRVALVRSVCRSLLRNPIEAEDAVKRFPSSKVITMALFPVSHIDDEVDVAIRRLPHRPARS